MKQCKRCGREATHFTIDGGDTDVCCAEYPNCTGDPARDVFGRLVREIWIEWARQQPTAKQPWLTPYDQLDEPDKEVDRRIGERLYTAGRASAKKWAWRDKSARLSASLPERAVLCMTCKSPRGEHPGPDEPGLGPATDCHTFEPMPSVP